MPEDIIAERNKADICVKCRTGPHKWFGYYVINPIVTKMVPKKGGVPQVRDTSKAKKTDDIKISAIGMEHEYVQRSIELSTDSEEGYELLKWLVACWLLI